MTTTLHASGVQYGGSGGLDEFKKLASVRAAQTLKNASNFQREWQLLEWTRGESVMLFKHRRCGQILGFLVEGLGTKTVMAEHADIQAITGVTNAFNMAWDNFAMFANDAGSLGALPFIFGVHPAVEDPSYFLGKRGVDLIEGTAQACEFAGCLYGPGETPGLRGIITPGTMCLSGAGVAQVPAELCIINPANLQAGHKIFAVASNGIHANGISAIRKVMDGGERKYSETLPSGRTFADALMRPTQIYIPFIRACQQRHISLSYASHISGHGWAKILRPVQEWEYHIHTVPPIPELFTFLQKLLGYSDRQMFSAYNMGQGFMVYAPAGYAQLIMQAGASVNLPVVEIGEVRNGPRRVWIDPLKIELLPEDADIR